MPLVLTSRPDERLVIGEGDQAVRVWHWYQHTPHGKTLKITVDGPRTVPVHREPRPPRK